MKSQPRPLTVKEFEYLEQQGKAIRELQGAGRNKRYVALLNRQYDWLSWQRQQEIEIHANVTGKKE